ncbi:MAG: hypothetical protein EOP83_03910 [Verrucomicrobiaceae bacterium]|nr:MAG: hypothetical protein EOP83_03910 [Verrucomicrobiaceae bacterium]
MYRIRVLRFIRNTPAALAASYVLHRSYETAVESGLQLNWPTVKESGALRPILIFELLKIGGLDHHRVSLKLRRQHDADPVGRCFHRHTFYVHILRGVGHEVVKLALMSVGATQRSDEAAENAAPQVVDRVFPILRPVLSEELLALTLKIVSVLN